MLLVLRMTSPLYHKYVIIVSHPYDYTSPLYVGSPWEGKGHVMKIDDNEISLEMRSNVVPTNIAGSLIYIHTLIHPFIQYHLSISSSQSFIDYPPIYLFIYLHSSTTSSTHHPSIYPLIHPYFHPYFHPYIHMYT